MKRPLSQLLPGLEDDAVEWEIDTIFQICATENHINTRKFSVPRQQFRSIKLHHSIEHDESIIQERIDYIQV